ncbi:MAG TPA: thioredoxin domain-containing protein [Syntrophorhabdaceae bacterium]|nr:thioredoxin domain-containing protein [Syntrophorhabdaceae bacterium]
MTRPDLKNLLEKNRYIITIILSLIAIGLEIFYTICDEACSYLHGDIFGIPMEYIGIGYMAFIAVLAIMKKDIVLTIFLSAGMAIEIYLLGFQVWHNIYCPYCLAFGGILLVIFLLNFNIEKKKIMILFAILSIIFFSIFFNATVTPLYAQDLNFPEFGNGPIKVRLYTDYFCPPCRAMEPKIEPVLTELINKNIITLTFIDAPFSSISAMYARYFLFIIHEKKDIENAFLARSVLIGAALKNIKEQEGLEAYLHEKRVRFKPFDTKPVFNVMNSYLKSDRIKATPTCIIDNHGKKQEYVGEVEILKALKNIKDTPT